MTVELWREALSAAFDALRSSRSRTVLTILSVVIGVASIVFCVSAGQSLAHFIDRQLSTLGTDLMWVKPVVDPTQPSSRAEPLTYEDAVALGRVPGIGQIGPRASRGVVVSSGRTRVPGELLAVHPGYFAMRNKTVALGRPLVVSDLDLRRRVCVAGPRIVERLLYRTPDPLGQVIKLDDKPFVVVGVLASTGTAVKTPGLEEENAVFIPLTTGTRIFGLKDLDFLFFQPDRSEARERLRQRIYQLLLLRKGSRSAYTIDSLEERMKQVENLIWVAVVVFAGIAAVSLLVAGIGIMNIMLLSVSERTREIGIRKSVGASKRHILAQFFSEAVVLSGTGGLLGVLAGSAAVSALGLMTARVITVSWLAVCTAFLVALATGIFFGLYPAAHAANMDPVAALAREIT